MAQLRFGRGMACDISITVLEQKSGTSPDNKHPWRGLVMSIFDRSKRIVNVEEFSNKPLPEMVGDLKLYPEGDQYMLRVCVKYNGGGIILPDCLK